MRKRRKNISHFGFILFNLKVCGEILIAFIFSNIIWKESVVWRFCAKNLFWTKCLKNLTVFDKILSIFCTDVVTVTKILPIGVKMDNSVLHIFLSFFTALKFDE